MLLFGALSYLGGAILLALPIAEAGAPGSVPVFVLARALQGVGVATVTPSTFAIVPGLVDRSRVGVGLAQAGTAQNLTMAFLPPLSLFVLDVTGLHGVATGIAAIVALGVLLTIRLERNLASTAAHRWVGFTWRPAWLMPLLIVVTMTVHWGVITSYMAQVAEPAGVNIGLFFTMDAVGVFLLRIPVGWLVDRMPPRPFVLAGLAGTLACVLLTLLPPSTPVYIASGLFAGAGGILVIGPMLMVMSHRSTDRDRGSGFAFFYVAMALGNAVGSIGGAPLVTAGGFTLAMAVLGVGGLVVSALVTLVDGGLGRPSGIALAREPSGA
jgi:MFS family permease